MPRMLFVGFDVRERVDEPDAEWDASRRETYLLRLDIARPLSIDRRVWRARRLGDGELVDPPPWVELETLRQRAIAPYALVAMGLLADSAEDDAIARARGADADMKAEPTWRFLGFDVLDGAISGLSNCGYAEDGVAALRATWGPRLNEHGLFADPSDALVFRAATNDRVPEHAPFVVGGIWLVEQVG
jgi:hypothetical protein